MKVDLYTKAVLTVIALCLIWVCARDIFTIPIAQAAAPAVAQEVIITGIRIPLKDSSGASINDSNGKPVFIGALPVRQAND